MSKKRILVISDRIPVDSTQAGAPRIFELCKSLSDEFDFYFILITPESQNPPHSSEQLFIEFDQVLFTPDKSSLWVKCFRWLTPTSSFDFRITNKKKIQDIRLKIEDYYNSKNIDLIIVDGLKSTQFIPTKLKQNAIFEMCDCLAKLQLRSLSAVKNFRTLISNITEFIGIWFWERKEINTFKNSTIVSEDELKSLIKYHPGIKKPVVVPLGISCDYFKSDMPVPKKPSLIFFGSLSYSPNLDSCIWLLDEIFPKLINLNPEIELKIVGANPTPQLLSKLKNSVNVYLHPDVDDVRPFIEDSAVFISPMRLGAGTKNKLLVSISMERPVISSTMGLEGISEQLQDKIIIADSTDEFVKKTNELLLSLNSEKHYNNLLKDLKIKRTILSEIYSWKVVSLPLRQLLKNN